MTTPKLVAALGVAAMVLTCASMVDAATVYARQRHQQYRIAHGIASGSLTAREAARLEVRELSIVRQEARMRADDGVLGPAERAVLQHRLDRTAAAIWRQKHDAQHR